MSTDVGAKRRRRTSQSHPSPSPAAATESKRHKPAISGRGIGDGSSTAGFATQEEAELRAKLLDVRVTHSELRQTSKGKAATFTVEATREGEDGEEQIDTMVYTDANFRELHDQLRSEGALVDLPDLRLPGVPWIFPNSDENMGTRAQAYSSYLQKLATSVVGERSVTFRSFLKPKQRDDWPAHFGPIDLTVHDLPHESSVTEWWYYNMHFTTTDGRNFSAFVAFFRILKAVDGDKKYYAHALNWAMTDADKGTYVQESRLDPDSSKLILEQLNAPGSMLKDRRLKKAYEEMLQKGGVPLPDRLFEDEPAVSKGKLDLDYHHAAVQKTVTGNYHVTAVTTDGKNSLDVTLVPQKAPVRHGLDGVVKGHEGDDMFYYFIPRNTLSGKVVVDGEELTIAKGEGWYDHEFGGTKPEQHTNPMQYAWNWAAVQCDNGWEISTALLVDPRVTPMKFMETRVVLVDPAGRRYQPTDLTFDAVEGSTWTSLRTFSKYPMKWDIRVPSLDIDIRIEAEVHDQEFITIICRHAYWEGRVKASGKMFGKPVGGLGYVERNGFQTLSVLSDFFKRVGAATRLAVEKAYPLKMSHDDAMTLVADKGLEYYLDGVPYDVVEKNLVGPVREICDRGGKSWRSYGALSCIDVVGGDCRRFARWLAMPEFMHVGSLIVDDIQDDSMTRRGGPCAHLVYGVPIAINAGTAAYFQAQKQLLVPGLTDSQLASLYDLYFQALRAGHAGQALDITGLDYLMDSALATGNAALAESRSLAIHRLKTAVPAGALARMGAVAGEGTKQQVEAVGRYFEGIGVAFQIMDDVLNLRGLRTTKADLRENVVLKVIGEDIMAGKVTMPVVKAISRLPKEEMGNLWDIIKSKPQEPEVVADCIQRLEDCGAVEACVEHAQSLVDDAWSVLDAAVPDSFAKIMLRAFGWFVIERAN